MLRGWVWALLALIMTPVVAVGFDSMSVATESDAFTPELPDLESIATYDLSVRSTSLGDFMAPGALRIAFAATGVAPDATEVVVVTERLPAPWDYAAPAVAQHPGPPVGAEQILRIQERVRLPENVPLERQEILIDRRWHEEDGVWLAGVIQNRTIHQPAPDEGPFAEIAAILDSRFPLDHETLLPRSAPERSPSAPAAKSARLDGEQVVMVTRERAPEKSLDTSFGCAMRVPFYEYREAEPTAELEGRKVWSHTTERLVFHAERFFPLLVICENVVRSADATSEVLGHVRLVARLASATPGDGPLPFRGDVKDAPRYNGAPAEGAVRRDETGLPRDDDPLFLFPLQTAYEAVRESSDARLVAFRDTDLPFAVRAGLYDPQAHAADCELHTLVGCPAALPPPERIAVAEPRWVLNIQNRAGEMLEVTVVQGQLRSGNSLAAEVTDIQGLPAAREKFDVAAVPTRLVPPSAVLADWLQHHDHSIEQWRGDREARFFISYPDDAAAEPRYAVSVAYEPKTAPSGQPFEPFDPYASRQTTDYGGVSGKARETMSHIEAYRETPPPAPIGATYVDFAGGLRPEPHDPTVALVAGTLTLVAIAVVAHRSVLEGCRRLVVLLLFTKLKKKEVLENETRARILAYITENPGARTQEVRTNVRIGWGTAIYHLNALEQHGHATGHTFHGRRYWFPQNLVPSAHKDAFAVLRSDAARRLYHVIQEHPDRTQRQIAQILGVTHGAVIFHARRLEQAGLIKKRREGRVVRYFLS